MQLPEHLQALEAYWCLKRRSRLLPDRSGFGPLELRPWLGHIAVIAVERQQGDDDADMRFRVALSGMHIDDYRGSGVTNRYLDDLTRGRTSTEQHYRCCVATRQPVRFLHDNSHNSVVYPQMLKLLLPLSQDGHTVDRIIVGVHAEPQRMDCPLAA
ncbi:PAS domain-containing protein [Ferrovibrio sp.]|uniref:PAS domain-containing protein n=1 Tax=Ferrovibrio sp. TaxID=1917215 RepID=UPI003D0B7DC3